ncbi:MAG: segregation and condensation protein B [Psychrobacter glaciei]|jgi:segregation and condensation protein B
MTISDALLEQIIEGALLSSGQTLSIDRIQSLFEEGLEPEKQRILTILERIGEKCQNNGYELKKVATGYRFQVKQEIVQWVSRLWDEKPQRYSRALLETLSIIAYRQPCTRGEIEDVRGVAVSSHITKTLVEREWIQVVGHRDVPGRPAMFATTKMFLDYFNLESLDQLPTLEEIQEIADANHALELEDKKEEGDFDLSISVEEMGDSENLISAAADLEAADALVQQVEDNLSAKAEEEQNARDEEKNLQDQNDLLSAEQQVAEADEQVFSLSDSMRDSLGGSASKTSVRSPDQLDESEQEMTEEQLAEATIARMIAEQESLLNQAGKGSGSFSSAPASNENTDQQAEIKDDKAIEINPLDHDEALLQQSGFSSLVSTLDDEQKDTATLDNAPSVFAANPVTVADDSQDNAEDDEDDLAAALEEEMLLALEAEMLALEAEQEKSQ